MTGITIIGNSGVVGVGEDVWAGEAVGVDEGFTVTVALEVEVGEVVEDEFGLGEGVGEGVVRALGEFRFITIVWLLWW